MTVFNVLKLEVLLVSPVDKLNNTQKAIFFNELQYSQLCTTWG